MVFDCDFRDFQSAVSRLLGAEKFASFGASPKYSPLPSEYRAVSHPKDPRLFLVKCSLRPPLSRGRVQQEIRDADVAVKDAMAIFRAKSRPVLRLMYAMQADEALFDSEFAALGWAPNDWQLCSAQVLQDMDASHFPAGSSSGIGKYVTYYEKEEVFRSEQLRQRLADTPAGPSGWRRYEDLLEETLNYLFTPALEKVEIQSPDGPKVNRRDFIMANRGTEDFWGFLQRRYGADYIVFEAKDYTGDAGKSDVLQLANYLNPFGLGMLGFIVTRQGLDDGGVWTARTQWVSYNKMILTLTDSDVIEMLDAKESACSPVGGPPTQPEARLRDMLDAFRASM